jgi:hypothetical protein
MSTLETESLVAALTRDLVPVRPLPKLRTVLAAIGIGWLGASLLAALVLAPGWGGPSAALGIAPFGAALAGLALAAAGALVAGLAGSVPGRDHARATGERVLAAGISLCGLGTMAAFLVAPGLESPGEHCLECLTRSGGLALLPALVATLYVARGANHRLLRSCLLAAVGCGALGAISVQLACLVDGGKHLLIGHMLAPLVVGIVLGVPMLVVSMGRRRLRPSPGQDRF